MHDLPPSVTAWLQASTAAGRTPPPPSPSPLPAHGELGPAPGLLPAKDPLKTPLPRAPSLQIFCMHGVGIPTERGYLYRYQGDGQRGVWRLNETAGEEGGPVVTTDGMRMRTCILSVENSVWVPGLTVSKSTVFVL